MKLSKIFNILAPIALSGIMAASLISCEKNPDEQPAAETGIVQGTVTDSQGIPVADVSVGVTGTSNSVVTAVDGAYKLENVPIGKLTVEFVKEGFATASASLSAGNFKNKVATVDMVLEISGGIIKGKCVDSEKEPFAGVEVILNDGAARCTTGEDGTYIFQNLTIDDYTLLFKKTDCVDVEKTVDAELFTTESNYTVELADVVMGGKEVLRGQTADDLAGADVWHYNEYRGGKNGDDYPHFDWSSDYIGTFTSFWGWWEEQNEGTAIQIRNSEGEGHCSNPEDLKVFDSYLAGRKKITADNCKMYLKVRTHGATEADPLPFGVQVVDLAAADPTAVLIGEIRYHGSDSYSNPDYEFDLTPYIGKEVVIAIGVFRARTGDYWKQLCLRRIAFAKEAPLEWGYLPGTSVAGLDEGYKMTEEMVRSTMPVTEFSEFTGISPVEKTDIDGPEMYREAYKTWRPAGHFAAWWSCMPVKKDSEPFAGEGFVMKTNGSGTPVSLDAPQSYFYAKFAVSAGRNQLTINCRNFSSTNATFFKVTAITEDFTVKHLSPADDHGATSASEAGNGAWKFIHESGDADNPDAYAHFKYDLSEFNGKNAVIALAVFKGEDNGDENKLAIHSITIK